jgi:enediyne biosynthesis protein E4
MKTNRSPAATIAVLMALAPLAAQQFTEITTDPVVTDLGNSGFGTWADYDNDGYSDLFVTRDLGTTAIYRNNRNGTFSRIPKPPGLAAASYYTAYWCDWDNDGNQDLFALVDGTGHIGYGDGQGDYIPEFYTQASGSWGTYADYDRNGLIDNYMAWDGGNSLIHNRGNRKFATYTSSAELGPAAANTYGGPCWGDFDDDGWPDLYVPCLWQFAQLSVPE